MHSSAPNKQPKYQRSHWIMGAVLLGAIFLIAPLALSNSKSLATDHFSMTIVHTNDLHAHDEAFVDHGKLVGGFARIAYLVKHIKNSTPNVVAIDAGDIFQGTSFYRVYRGEVEVQLLNKAGYDIYTPGNHEFDNGPQNLAKQLSLAQFSIISTNLDTSANPQLARLIKPSVVKEINGQKIGFVGAITPELLRISLTTQGVHPFGVVDTQGKETATEVTQESTQPTLPANWYEPIAQEVDKLQKLGINKIVLVSHCGVDLDKQLAEAIPAIDVIVGGHSHTRLNEPIIVDHNNQSRTYIVQTGSYGRALGKLCVTFDKDGVIIPADTTYRLISITPKIPEDADIANFISIKAKPINLLKKKILGRAEGLFDNKFREQTFQNDSPLGDLICDAIAESGLRYGVTISLQNRGGIRSFIGSGLVSQEEIEELLPFDNTVVFATVSGANLLQILEHSVSRNYRGQFLEVHGLKFSYDMEKPPGSRILSVQVKDTKDNYKPLDPHAQYKIAVNSFTFNGGEGYSFASATNIVDSKLRTAQVLENYISKYHKIISHQDGRITTEH